MKSFLIGSLPFVDKQDAINFIQTFSLKTLCTLPKLDEREFMLHHSFLGLKSFDYYRNRVRKCSNRDVIEPFEFVLEYDFFKSFQEDYKWQCTGPVTMIETMENHEFDDLLLSEYLEKIILTQRKFNQLNKGHAYLFLDEPVLGMSPEHQPILISFIQNLKESGEFENVSFGLHCCSKVTFELSDIPIDLIALDYTLYTKDEWSVLQANLGAKLVAIQYDSDFNKLDYPLKDEIYESASCGFALSEIEKLII